MADYTLNNLSAVTLTSLTDILHIRTSAGVDNKITIDNFNKPMYEAIEYSALSSNTVLTKSGLYKVTAFCDITLPASLEVGEVVTIHNSVHFNIIQGDAENAIEFIGWATTKGITGSPDKAASKYMYVPAGSKIAFVYEGAGFYSANNNTSETFPATGYTNGQCIEFSPCGQYLAVGFRIAGTYNNLLLYKFVSGVMTLVQSVTCLLDNIMQLSWSPDGIYLAICSQTAATPSVQVFKRAGDVLTSIGTLTGTQSAAQDVKFSPNGVYLAVGSTAASPNVQFWKRTGDSFALLYTLGSTYTFCKTLAWSPDSTYVAATFNSAGASPLGLFKRAGDVFTFLASFAATATPWGVHWSPDGKYLAIAGVATTFSVYERTADSLALVSTITGTGTACQCPRWSPDGTYLAVTYDTLTHVYKRRGKTFTSLYTITNYSNGRNCAWSPDGKYLSIVYLVATNNVALHRTKQSASKMYRIANFESAITDSVEPILY